MLRLIYFINIFVFAPIGIISILNDELANIVIYQKAFSASPLMQLVGSIWLAIALISFLGLIYPIEFIPVLIFQALFKFMWLILSFTLLKDVKSPNLIIFFIAWLAIFSFTIFLNNLFKLKKSS